MLKIISLVTMFSDHLALVVLAPLSKHLPAGTLSSGTDIMITALRAMGRLTMPLIAFLLSEGFAMTSSKKKYLRRLLLFAVISEIPFDLAVNGRLFSSDSANVLWTLSISFAGLFLIKKSNDPNGPLPERCVPYIITLIAVTTCALAEFSGADHGAVCVISVYFFYFLRTMKPWDIAFGCMCYIMWFPAPLAFILLSGYNGKRSKKGKYFFYAFYPLHLLLLFGLSLLAG